MRAVAGTGVLLTMLSAVLVWIKGTIGGDMHVDVSFSWMAIFISALGAAGWFCRSSRVLVLSGIIGLGLCSFAVLHLAFRDPAFWLLIDENAQYANIMQFSRRALPANFGIEPGFKAHLATDTVLDRLGTALYFLSWGWWLCLAGSLMALAGCFKTGGRQHLRWTAIVTVLMVGSQGLIFFGGLAAQYRREQGDRHAAHGRYAQAIQRYEAAQRLDPQLSRSDQLHVALGEAYYHLGISSHAQARFYLGDYYTRQGTAEAAISAYYLATQDASAPLQDIVCRRLAWTYVKMGLGDYHNGAAGAAAVWWEKALATDPRQLQAAYFLSRTYFEQGRYEQSLAVSGFLLSRSHNRLLNANMQANIGDSYWKLNDFSRARRAYEASMRLDTYANYRIFKSLGGT